MNPFLAPFLVYVVGIIVAYPLLIWNNYQIDKKIQIKDLIAPDIGSFLFASWICVFVCIVVILSEVEWDKLSPVRWAKAIGEITLVNKKDEKPLAESKEDGKIESSVS